MKALCCRFETTSRRAEHLDRKIERTYRQLTRLLDEPGRKLLLKMADLEDALREEACLNSFISGYRLAQGIQQELLADQPPYNFENEDEQRACELAGKERWWMGKKRANGEGSIRKRKDGRWEGFYTAAYDPATGKQKIKNVLGKTQAEVKEKLKKAIADSQRLDMNRSGTHTVKSWVQMWYEVYAEPRLRENTKDYYLNYINNHIIPQLEDIKLDKLTTIQIQKFYNDLQKNGRVQRYQHIQLKNKGLSVRVVHGIHTLLNNCLEQAVAERLILVNPTRGCKLPKMEKREMKVLPEEKIRPYLMEADKRGLLAPFYLELTTGLRRGELLALLWTDLDVENRTISITKQVTRTKGELVVSQPKTHNSIRVLPVSQQAVDLLVEEHKKHPGNPYMFPSPKTGGMFDPDSFRHTHEKILKAIGAEHIRFHDLRHTFATLSLKNGVDVKTLSSTLGHYSAGFTLSTYTHATPDMMREAADTMGDVIGKAM